MRQVASRRLKDTVKRTFNALGARQMWSFRGEHNQSRTKSPEPPNNKYDVRISRPENERDRQSVDSTCHSILQSTTSFSNLTSVSLNQYAIVDQQKYLTTLCNLIINKPILTFPAKKCLYFLKQSVFDNTPISIPPRTNLQELVFSGVTTQTTTQEEVPNKNENDHLIDSDDKKSTLDLNGIDDDNLRKTVNDLKNIIGNIGFVLGVWNLKADRKVDAVMHFKLATTHGHASGIFNLGLCYETGTGVDRPNMTSATKCYQLAAALHHKKALYNLGVFYARGEGGLDKNRNAAAMCFKAAGKLK